MKGTTLHPPIRFLLKHEKKQLCSILPICVKEKSLAETRMPGNSSFSKHSFFLNIIKVHLLVSVVAIYIHRASPFFSSFPG